MLKLDQSQIEAAQDLGCNRIQVFTKSIFPQSVPGVISAAMMVFMPTMSSYVIPEILSEGKVVLFGNSIYLNFSNYQWGDGSFMALIMLLIVGITMLATRNFSEKMIKGVQYGKENFSLFIYLFNPFNNVCSNSCFNCF